MSQADIAVIRRFLDILAGKTDVAQGASIIDPNVVSHLDGITVRGISAWAKWLSFVRSRPRVSSLDLVCDRIVVHPDQTITPYGRWIAMRNGKRVESDEVHATYRIEDDRIVEIWTTRSNYILIFGPMMRYRIGCMFVLLELMLWSRLTTDGRKWAGFSGTEPGKKAVAA